MDLARMRCAMRRLSTAYCDCCPCEFREALHLMLCAMVGLGIYDPWERDT